MPSFARARLCHDTPDWVRGGSVFFITICCENRKQNTLCDSALAETVRESIRFRQHRGEWWTHLVVLMPDHLHMLASFDADVSIKKSIADWKRWLSRTSPNLHWQHGFFDHRLRDDENFDEKAHYLRMNPVRAGLVADWESWPYTWTADDLKG